MLSPPGTVHEYERATELLEAQAEAYENGDYDRALSLSLELQNLS